MGEASGQRFGKYTLLRRLAAGGMAEIFLAEHRGEAGFVRQVVIKRVLPNLCENQDFVTMFLDEARLLARLTHPNVVHIYDFGRIEDTYFLSLEYVHGGNLRDVLTRQRGAPVPTGQALYVVGQALAGLDHAHRAKGPDGSPLRLVHRDISPSNLLLSVDGAVKLADFGIARSTAQQVHTAAFVIKGKLAYMSPEQVTGRPLDGRSDLFSMGVVLWEMVTGRRLFARESAGDIQRAICAEPLPPVLSLRPELPGPVVELLDRSLRRDREERFPSAAAMQMAVDECMATCRLVGGAQHFAAYMKQLFPELTDEGASVDDNAPTVMRDPGQARGSTEILEEASQPSTTPGMMRPAPALPRPGLGGAAPAARPVSSPIALPVEPVFPPVSAPLTLPPSESLELMAQAPTTHLAPKSARARLVAPAWPAAALRAWLLEQWPTVSIGAAALVIGTVALWLLFSGGSGDGGGAAADAAVVVPDAARTKLPVAAARDSGATAALGPPRDAVTREATAPPATLDAGASARPAEPPARPREAEAPGMISIQARPSATAILDGRNLGETPIYRRRTPAGWHTLELRAKGLPPLKRRIQVPPGREFKRTFDLNTPDAR